MAIWAEIKKALNSTLGTSSFKSLDTLLTSAITSARDTVNTNVNTTKTYAQNSQNYTATNNTGSKTGILSQKLTYLISLLENGTYGLRAIKTNGLPAVKSVQRGTYDEMYNRGETATVTINSINTAKSILIINASVANSDTTYSVCGEITNSTTITLWHTNWDGGDAKYHSFYDMKWQVIEFY